MKKYLLVLIVCVMLMSCLFGKTLVMAGEEESGAGYSRYYTTIEIQKGDSLWSIAKTYNHHSGMSIREYIREVKQLNRILSDKINAGDSLTIIYFDESPKNVSLGLQ